MISRLCIFNTDLVNKYNQRIPLRGLAKGLIDNPYGMPQCMGHDKHRPVGWAKLLGLYFEKGVCSLIGVSNIYEGENENKILCEKYSSFQKKFLYDATINSKQQLLEAGTIYQCTSPQITHVGCSALVDNDIAAKVFPELFDKCDDDGLIALSDVLVDFTYFGDGIFCSKTNNFAVIVHQYFRKRLSIHNNYCNLFLNELILTKKSNWNVKIRIDRNVLGWKHDVQRSIELEYWYGPKFDNDISKIPYGIAKYKASKIDEEFNLIDSTDFFWYNDKQTHTFQCEEIATEPSVGISSELYGMRYIHSIFNHDKQSIVHFDAAIRMYNEEKYLKRLDSTVDKVDKDCLYTKLFRIDGQIEVSDWKRLCVLYMQGNTLVSEYFGIKQFPDKNNHEIKEISRGEKLSKGLYRKEYGPRAFLSYIDGAIDSDKFDEFDIFSDGENKNSVVDSDSIELVKELKKNGLNLQFPDNVLRMDVNDSYINIPTIKISNDENFEKKISLIIQSLCSVLSLYKNHYSQKNIAFTLAWPFLERIAKLSFIGGINDVLDCVNQVTTLPKTEKEFLDFAEKIQKNINQYNVLENTYDKLSSIGLNGNIRLLRKSILASESKTIKLDENGKIIIELANDAIDFLKKLYLKPVLALNITSSQCSVCGKEYQFCEHQKYKDENCFENIKDFQFKGIFWSINDECYIGK